MNITEIWNIYHKDVRHFILSKVKDNDLAEDLLQETFIKIHTKLYTLNDINKLKSWIFGITRNTVMDYFRSKKIDCSSEEELADEFSDPTPLDHTVEDCLKEIMKHLDKKYREPLFLYDIKGMKQTEITIQLGLPLSTIKSQIQRGRKQIIEGFINCCGFELNSKGQLIGEIKNKK